jgi:hypothetical protein
MRKETTDKHNGSQMDIAALVLVDRTFRIGSKWATLKS